MSRIQARMKALRAAGRKALVPYIVAGDPVTDQTVALMHALVASGADILELGVPFSDPMAEGPVIQLAHERALEHGTSLSQVLDMVAEFRRTDADTPVVLMGYANPVEIMGYERFAHRASEAGVDGVLTVDLPPEEAAEFNAILKSVAIDTIFLIAPTTSAARLQAICAAATGYLYYVSLKGVTGAGHLDLESVARNLEQIKMVTELPVCVGFGIKDPQSARAIADLADGAVVGSVLVNRMAEIAAGRGSAGAQQSGDEICAALSAMLAAMRQAIDERQAGDE